VIRHPMPYGDLKKQIVQRFATKKDLELHNCTIEEREEYEHLIEYGITVYAGIDYELILRQAEKEADVILWDGGNNDTPFYKPDVWITVADPLRVGHEREYYPGELNFIKADTIVINKYKQATKEQLVTLLENIKICNPTALVIRGASIIKVDNPADIKNKKVVIIEDGPTLTHGNMTFGAGTVAARQYGARVVDPRKYAIGSIARTYVKYPQLEKLIPALGYYPKQLRELEQTVNAVPADIVLVASPTDLTSVIDVNKPMVRVSYSLEEIGKPNLITVIEKLLKKKKLI
ncbi:GTPase, partial [bacterium]|nr:GTPase [bacterium]